MLTIRFNILIFYKDEVSLKQYLKEFYLGNENDFRIRNCKDYWIIESEGIRIICIRGLYRGRIRGQKAHIVAVQEDLTWDEDWETIRDCDLSAITISPIDIQVFDGTV